MAELKTKIKFTYDDYKSLPESETKRYELLEGELVMVPSPTYRHQLISGKLEFLLRKFIQENDLGIVLDAPFDVVFEEAGERRITQPDIFFISKERTRIITEGEIRGAPDLVVEIISPGTEERDRGYKKTLYARHGVKEYWVVDPEAKTVEVFTRGEKGFELIRTCKSIEALKSPLLEELEIDLQDGLLT